MTPRSLMAPAGFQNRIVDDLPFAEYLETPGVSKSLLSEFSRSPIDGYDWLMRENEKPTDAMLVGKFIDDLIFNGGKTDWYYIRPDTYHNEKEDKEKPWNGNATDCRSWLSQHADKPVFSQGEVDEYKRMADAVASNQKAARAIRDTIPQSSFFVRDEETGLILRGRPDWRGAGKIVDLKYTNDASPEAFSKTVAKMRYHIQGAIYLDGCNWAGCISEEFILIAVQSDPIRVNVRRLKCTSVDCGREIYRQEITQLAECIRRNHWPDYSGSSDDIEEIAVPSYEINRVFGGSGESIELSIGGSKHAL